MGPFCFKFCQQTKSSPLSSMPKGTECTTYDFGLQSEQVNEMREEYKIRTYLEPNPAVPLVIRSS